MTLPSLVYVGLKAHVAAIDPADGRTVWKTKLKGVSVSGERFVTLLVDDGRVYAHSYGELFCLDAATGHILWKNELDGLSYDIASLAVEGGKPSSPSAQQVRRKHEAAPAAAAVGAGAAASSS